ncbi:hypothetical protein VLK81_03455 [Citroniella saccharovorans]|uniref:Uncharacterized protein n=1 Tax=Citroniella saccharovorans TaxID=2053367 RepID=A0AAW9MTZ5_9FIRM|nr:hypothetical protein [Citroniella saccharovorans]MEB3429084.1 hypothetical protein [Citroniella saccharovorans]
MKFEIPKFREPDFNQDFLKNAPNCTLEQCPEDGISPENYHALSVYPEYFKINGKWVLATESRMDTVAVAIDEEGKEKVNIVEFRNLKKGDKVVIGRTENAEEGIYMWTKGFESVDSNEDNFAFRSGRSRETAFSIDYDNLYELLKHEKANGGYITWVIGSAVALDKNARDAFEGLVKKGFVDAVFCGNNTAAIDLENGVYGSTWGQDIFVKEQNTNNNIYETINLARSYGSMKAFMGSGKVEDGFIKALYDRDIPVVISCSIRDRLPLPEAYTDVYKAQDAMRAHTRKSSTIIMLSAILFTIASGNMTPSYNKFNGEIRPVYLYTVDIQEFAVNKLADRGTLTATSIVTNTQDFLRNVNRSLE